MKEINLDAYEKKLEEKLENADAAGILKSKLTSSRAKELQQAARDTLVNKNPKNFR